MRAVMSRVPPEILAWRERTGADRFDEMWDGVLHMGPCPDFDHQNLEGALETWLRQHWAPASGGVVAHQVNVARAESDDWHRDCRIPDLVVVKPGRIGINRNEYFAGGPDVVVEIRSPGDETDEKLPFYLEIGVTEVWVIDRDTKKPVIHAIEKDGSYEVVAAGAHGWLRSAALDVELRRAAGDRLELRRTGAKDTWATLP